MLDNVKSEQSLLKDILEKLDFEIEQARPIAFAEDVDPKNGKILHRFIDEMSAVYMAVSCNDLNKAFRFASDAQSYFQSLEYGSVKRHAIIANMGLPSMPTTTFKALKAELLPFIR